MPFGSGRQNRGGVPTEYIATIGSTAARYLDIAKLNQAQQEFKSVQGRVIDTGNLGNSNFARISVSPNGQYMFVTGNTSPYYFFFKRVGDNWLKLNFSIPFPSTSNTAIYGGAWSPDSTVFVTYYTAAPYLTTFVRNGDTFTQYLNFPSGIITNTGYDINWMPNGWTIATGFVNGAIKIFNYTTATNTWTNVVVTADQFATGTSQTDSQGWNYNGTQLIASYSTSPPARYNNVVYNYNGTSLTTASGITFAAATSFATRFNPVNTTTVAIAGFVSPYLTIAIQNTSGAYTSTGVTISSQPGAATNRGEWSSDGQAYVTGLQASPYLAVYLQTGTNYYQSLDISSLGLITAVTDVQWINYPGSLPNHSRFGIYFSAIPYYQEYAINGTSVTNVASVIDWNPLSAQPSGAPSAGNGNFSKYIGFNYNGSYLVSQQSTTPYFNMYSRSGDTFTRLTTPGTLPSAAPRSLVWSNNNPGSAFGSTSYLVTTLNAASPLLYYVTGTTITYPGITIPTANIGVNAGASWSPDDANFVIGGIGTPFIATYATSTNTNWTLLSSPTTIPTSSPRDIAYSPDGSMLAVGLISSPGLMIYTTTNNIFNLTGTNITTFPNATVQYLAWSPDSQFLALAQGTSPYLRVYSRSVNTYTSATINILPSAMPQGITWNYDGSKLYIQNSTGGIWTYNKTGTNLTFVNSSTQDWNLATPVWLNYIAIF